MTPSPRLGGGTVSSLKLCISVTNGILDALPSSESESWRPGLNVTLCLFKLPPDHSYTWSSTGEHRSEVLLLTVGVACKVTVVTTASPSPGFEPERKVKGHGDSILLRRVAVRVLDLRLPKPRSQSETES
jgi:hypothetical protein